MANMFTPYFQQPMVQQPMMQQPVMQPQIQNSGFVSVRNENEARNYPIGYGNSITFKDENAPYVYVKTMGFSQLDSPVFEKFKLIKEDAEEKAEKAKSDDKPDNTINTTIDDLKGEIKALWGEIKGLKNANRKQTDKGGN